VRGFGAQLEAMKFDYYAASITCLVWCADAVVTSFCSSANGEEDEDIKMNTSCRFG
jgi:hypothetical protein